MGESRQKLVILCRIKITHTHRCLLLKRFSSSWTQEALTLVFVSLVLGQILQQVLVDGQRTAARHLLDGVETTQKKWGGVKDSAGIYSFFSLWHCDRNQQNYEKLNKAVTHPTVITSPEFLSVTKLLAMVMIIGSMIYTRRECRKAVTPAE